MDLISNVFNNFKEIYTAGNISTTEILTVLLVVLILSIYEFIIYRYVSHRAFYNKSFNISIVLLPFFISTIIMCLQSNVIITLGTIGALAIIRFRTSVKDPVDMMYILWATYIGIICGCGLFEVAVLTSLVVTVVLLALEHISFGRKPIVLIIHTINEEENMLREIIKKHTKKYKFKSRNYTSSGMDYAIELAVKNIPLLVKDLKKNKKIEKFSVIEYDADDIV